MDSKSKAVAILKVAVSSEECPAAQDRPVTHESFKISDDGKKQLKGARVRSNLHGV